MSPYMLVLAGVAMVSYSGPLVKSALMVLLVAFHTTLASVVSLAAEMAFTFSADIAAL